MNSPSEKPAERTFKTKHGTTATMQTEVLAIEPIRIETITQWVFRKTLGGRNRGLFSVASGWQKAKHGSGCHVIKNDP